MNSTGKILGVNSGLTSDQRDLQAALGLSELRFRRLFEASRDGMLIIDAETLTIIDANPFVSEILDSPHETLLGKDLFEIGLLKDDLGIRTAFAELQSEGVTRYDQVSFQTKTGCLRHVEFVSNLYQEGKTKVIQCQIRDATVRKEAEDALRGAQAQLANRARHLETLVAARTADLTATNHQLEAFVFSIAHDLRAPLRAMQGFSAMLLEEEAGRLSDPGRDCIARIDKAAQHMDALLHDLLAFSNISPQHVELTPVRLEKIVDSVLLRLQSEIQEKNARVEKVGPWPAVLAHEATLAQALFNLGNNALKFRRPDIPPLLHLRTETNGEWVRLWVEDNGIGIDPAHHDEIFRLFTRLNGDKYAGTGLGLAIVRQALERMGGQVGVKSTPSEGSRFWIELKKP